MPTLVRLRIGSARVTPHLFALQHRPRDALVVQGTADRMLPFKQHAKSLVAHIPGVELLAIEGGEHASIFTHRDEVRTRVTRFLCDHAPQAGICNTVATES